MLQTLATAAILVAALALPAHAQFDLEDSTTTASLRGIHSLGGGIAWASGTDGTVLRTEDGGFEWQHCPIPPGAEHLDFRGIQAFDENTAVVMSSGKGDLSRLYKTTDGCRTWRLLFTNPDKDGFWDALQFRSRKQGALLGDPVDHAFVLLRTSDGGTTWHRQPLPPATDPQEAGAFAASNSSLVLTAGRQQFCTGGLAGPKVFAITDGSSVQPPQANPLPTQGAASDASGCFSLAGGTRPGSPEIAVGGDYKAPDEAHNTAWTTSPGTGGHFAWHPAETPPHGYRSSVAYDAAHKAWITVGPNGSDVSTDGGRHWRPLQPTSSQSPNAGTDKDWNALSLPFVVGPHGRIGKLRDDALKP